MAANQSASLKHQFGILMEHNYKRNKVSRQKNKNFYRMIEKKRLKKQKNTVLGQLLGNAPILPTQPRIVDPDFFHSRILSRIFECFS